VRLTGRAGGRWITAGDVGKRTLRAGRYRLVAQAPDGTRASVTVPLG